MDRADLTVHIPPELRFFLPPRHRHAPIPVPHDPHATLGHTIQTLGVPLTEVGPLYADHTPVSPQHRPAPGQDIQDFTPDLPPATPTDPPPVLLDVHPGPPARPLRLLVLDTTHA